MREAEYKILVVDDEPEAEAVVRQRMRRGIRSRKCDFEFVRENIDALDAISAGDEIDMVLTDINIQHIDGAAHSEDITFLTLRRS